VLLDVRFVLLMAAGLIGGTLWWCLHQSYNVILSYADVPTHLNLARRVHDDLHPGLGQLGDYWLPLTHVLELPFIWIDPLWRSGLAGSIPSMACYLLSVWLLYQLAFLATSARLPAVIASLAFAANPNVLYLHVLPMFEPAIIASMLAAAYLLARWLKGGGFSMLIAAAVAISVACTSRYEVWAFAIASAVVVAMALWQRGLRGYHLRGHLLFFLVLAWYGIALWLLWNLSLSGDPIYFLHPSFNKNLGENRLAILTKRQIPQSIAYVFYSVADNMGPILVGLGALGLWRYAMEYGLKARGLWLYLLAMPALFDVFYLWFKGTPPILVPQLIPFSSGNIRYGVVSAPFLCILAAYLARPPVITIGGPALWARLLVMLRRMLPWLWPPLQIAVLAAVLIQPIYLGKLHYVVSYTEANDAQYRASQQSRTVIAHWLAVHYDGGLILMSTFKGADRIIIDSGLQDNVFVHEGSQNTWRCALANPQRWVRWIVISRRQDGAARLLKSRSVAGRLYFKLMYPSRVSGDYLIFRRNSRPWIPQRRGPCS
jgi:4-amino-4-deoxy-L-arabinose transferase-like glycosyltransferase